MAPVDPSRDVMPPGAHEGYKKGVTELHCGGRGIDKIDSDAMARFPNLEVLWLNSNRLSKLQGLEHNFRLKHLYLHDNCITTLTNTSCCLTKLWSLETLQLSGNQLQDLKATLEVLSQLRNLRRLGLAQNPLALEGAYREAVIFAIPTLEHLDATKVTPMERAAAVKFFTAPRIEKKYAFGTVPKIWEKLALVKIGDPSVGELQLRREIKAATRRRQLAAEEKVAKELRDASRPRFSVAYEKEATAVLSSHVGKPIGGHQTFEFVARGRVPHLLVRLGFLSITPAAKAAANSIAMSDASRVHIAVSALGVLPAPLTSRDVVTSHLQSEEERAHLGFEDALFSDAVYADAYDKVQQCRKMGKLDELAVTFTLRETTTGTPVGVARVPLAPLLEEHVEKTYTYDRVPLLPPRKASASGLGLSGDMPVGHLSLSLLTDWGLSNTTAGEGYGNSTFEFARRRREAAAAAGNASAASAPPPPPPNARVHRDFAILSSLARQSGDDGDAADVPMPQPSGFKFDAAAYAEFARSKEAQKPVVRSHATYTL